MTAELYMYCIFIAELPLWIHHVYTCHCMTNCLIVTCFYSFFASLNCKVYGALNALVDWLIGWQLIFFHTTPTLQYILYIYILMYILIDRYNDVINQGGRVCQLPILVLPTSGDSGEFHIWSQAVSQRYMSMGLHPSWWSHYYVAMATVCKVAIKHGHH